MDQGLFMYLPFGDNRQMAASGVRGGRKACRGQESRQRKQRKRIACASVDVVDPAVSDGTRVPC
jgi:hypothetical protein